LKVEEVSPENDDAQDNDIEDQSENHCDPREDFPDGSLAALVLLVDVAVVVGRVGRELAVVVHVDAAKYEIGFILIDYCK